MRQTSNHGCAPCPRKTLVIICIGRARLSQTREVCDNIAAARLNGAWTRGDGGSGGRGEPVETVGSWRIDSECDCGKRAGFGAKCKRARAPSPRRLRLFFGWLQLGWRCRSCPHVWYSIVCGNYHNAFRLHDDVVIDDAVNVGGILGSGPDWSRDPEKGYSWRSVPPGHHQQYRGVHRPRLGAYCSRSRLLLASRCGASTRPGAFS